MPAFSASTVFLVLAAILSVACLACAAAAFFGTRKNERVFSAMLLSCGLLLSSYIVFLTSDNQTLSYTAGCFCYAFVDIAIIATLAVAFELTGESEKFLKTPLSFAAYLFALIDSLVFITAPLTGAAGTCEPVYGGGLIKWQAHVSAYHYIHTVVCYVLVLVICAIITRKAKAAPRPFQNRYVPALAGIACVPVCNLLILVVLDNSVDYSILLYGVVALFVYFTGRLYGEKTFFIHGIQRQLLDEIGQAIMLFDDSERLIVSNRDARLLVEKYLPANKDLQTFMEATGLSRTIPRSEQRVRRSFRWVTELATEERSFRVDYRPLCDSSERFVGTLFIFIDDSLETDVITGLSSKAVLQRWLIENAEELPKPTSFITFDINGLTRINNEAGREHGDRALRLLTDEMRNVFPPVAQYARLDEGMLLAVVPGAGASKVRSYADQVVENMSKRDVGAGPLSVSYAVSVSMNSGKSPRDALSEATHALNFNKLRSPESSHSSLLDSLMQTLYEAGITSQASCERMSFMAQKLGDKLGLSDYERTILTLLCYLHDLGMIGVPLDIQMKPGSLSDDEFDLLKRHAFKGFRIANASDALSEIAPLILHHHERWDGKGYPDGLAKEAIPVLDRIVSVVEAYEALISDRPYRDAVTPAEAIAEIRRSAGEQFDPYIVACFSQMLEASGCLVELGENASGASRADAFTRPKGVYASSAQEFAAGQVLAKVEHSHYKIDAERNIVSIDDAFTRMTGYTKEDLDELSLNQMDLIFSEEKDEYNRLCAQAFSQDEAAMLEHRLRRKDGEEAFVLCVGKVNEGEDADDILIADIADTHVLALQLTDLQDRARRNVSYWENAARIDSLTGILNRNSFKSEVQQILARKDCGIVFGIADADNFKAYNDTYGHPEGDELLKLFARELDSGMTQGGFAGRMGGDEFAFAFALPHYEGIDDEFIVADAQKCYEHVAEAIKDSCRGATISMGIAIVEADILSFDEVYRHADEALYDVKEHGRAHVKAVFVRE